MPKRLAIDGVLAVHSLSKRSNMAGLRAGFVAGDRTLIGYLGEVRKHGGLMMPAPVQAAAAAALVDDEHVRIQQARYARRRAVAASRVSGASEVRVRRRAHQFRCQHGRCVPKRCVVVRRMGRARLDHVAGGCRSFATSSICCSMPASRGC